MLVHITVARIAWAVLWSTHFSAGLLIRPPILLYKFLGLFRVLGNSEELVNIAGDPGIHPIVPRHQRLRDIPGRVVFPGI